MNRRSFMKNGLLGGVMLSTGATLYGCTDLDILQTDIIDDEVAVVLSVLIPVVLDGALPVEPQVRTAKINRVIEGIRFALKKLPPATHKELSDLFGLLNNRLVMLAFVGSFTPMSQMTAQQVMSLLEAWRNSFVHLLNIAYEGLKELIFAAWYGNPDNWQTMGYNKPNLGV